MKAQFVKNLTTNGKMGQKALFKMEPPLEGHEFVVVSGVDLGTIKETFIFPASELGEFVTRQELKGSFSGEVNIHRALHNAGYEPKY